MRTNRRSLTQVGAVRRPSALRRCALAASAIGWLLAPPGVVAVQDDEPSGRAGVITLFDGKTLDGWKAADFANPGEVKVEAGAIVMGTGRPMTGITTTRRDLPRLDYELRYEARRLDGNDFFAAATFPVGGSFITLVNGGWGGGVTGLSSLNGMDASENETNRSFKYQNQTWYRFRVHVTAAAIRAWVDGKEIFAVNYQGAQVGTRVETHANQPLGFATWETRGAVRGVAVRPLTAAEVAATNKAAEPRDR